MGSNTTKSAKTTQVVKSAIKAVQNSYDEKDVTKKGHTKYGRTIVSQTEDTTLALKWKPSKELILEKTTMSSRGFPERTELINIDNLTEEDMKFIIEKYAVLKAVALGLNGEEVVTQKNATSNVVQL